MARPRKNAPKPNTQELSLVPVEEQPYPLPEGWKWVRLGDVAEIVTGGTPSKKNPEFYGGDFPFFKPSDLDAGRHVFLPSEYLTQEGKLQCRIIPANSIGICCIGSIGKSGYFDIECTTNQQINTAIPKFNALYLYYYTKTISFTNELWQKASATTIAIVNKTKLESCTFPLPPLDEQERIVARIESLFAKLDEAKEKAEAVLDSYETRKAAILHKAFTGELTAKWREEKGVALNEWKTFTLQDVCCKKITDGTHQTPKYSTPEEGIAFISSKDVTTGVINWNNIKYITKELHEELYARIAPQRDDVLLAKNGTTGIAALVDTDKVFDIYVTLALLRAERSLITPNYLLQIINSPICKEQFNSHLTGIGVPNLHLRDIKAVTIPVPPLAEQQEITRILDILLEKEQQSKEAAETVLEQIDLMKRAILAKAFRGELGN